MAKYRLLSGSYQQLDAIYEYSLTNWETKQAEKYVSELFDCFEAIAKGQIIGRPIPAEFEVNGSFTLCNKHIIYWENRGDNKITIVAILHQRMHHIERLFELFNIKS